MKRLLAMSALLAVVGVTAAQAQVEEVFPLNPGPSAGAGAVDETTTLWFVQLKGNPKADGGTSAALAAKRQQFREEAGDAGILFNERFTYDNLFNGLSIAVDTAQVGRLKQLGSVRRSSRSRWLRCPSRRPARARSWRPPSP